MVTIVGGTGNEDENASIRSDVPDFNYSIGPTGYTTQYTNTNPNILPTRPIPRPYTGPSPSTQTNGPSRSNNLATNPYADNPEAPQEQRYHSDGRPIVSSEYGTDTPQGQIERGLNESQEEYDRRLADAIEALSNGETEASDEIMAGLGMSIEERTKFFDIAKDNLNWVVDFGKARQGNYSKNIKSSEEALGQSKQFLDHYKELTFNPDAIYGTEVYNSIKNRAVQEWGNFYSGKGLLSGNAQEGMVDRMSELAYGFLQGERNSALQGINAGNSISNSYLGIANQDLQAIGQGANASNSIANLAFQTGDSNANDIMSAHGALANITQAFNPADTIERGAVYTADGIANARTAQANATLAQQLGEDANRNNLITAGVSGATEIGSTLLENYLSGTRGDAPADAKDAVTLTGSAYGNNGDKQNSSGPAGTGFYNQYDPFQVRRS